MQAQYGLDLADEATLARVTWRKLTVLVAALPAESALASVLRARRKAGDVVPDVVVDDEAGADEFWRRRAARHLAGKGPH